MNGLIPVVIMNGAVVIVTIIMVGVTWCIYQWAYDYWQRVENPNSLFVRAILPTIPYYLGLVFIISYLDLKIGLNEETVDGFFAIGIPLSFMLSTSILFIGKQRGKIAAIWSEAD